MSSWSANWFASCTESQVKGERLLSGGSPINDNPILLKRLTYAKCLYTVAREGLHSPSPVLAAEALLRLHDSVEIFQAVVLDKIGVPRMRHGGFMAFWQQVEDETPAKFRPPYKDRFQALNDMRAAFKHNGTLPNLSELVGLSAIVPSFFSEVSARVLELDFSRVSLADLLDDTDAQEHVRNAEAAMAMGDYPRALSEVAVAFDLVISRRESSLPRSISLGLFGESTLSHHDLRFAGLELRSEDRAALRKNFIRLQSQVQEIKKLFEMLAWGVDLHQYRRFKYLTPHVLRTYSGEVQLTWRGSLRARLGKEEADFALQFAVDTALKVQTRKFRVVDPRSAVIVRIVVETAKLFRTNPDNTVTPFGEVPGACELRGTFVHVAGLGEAWRVKYEGAEGYIRVGDAMPLYEASE